MSRFMENIDIAAPMQALIYRSRAAIEITPLILMSVVEVSNINNRRDDLTGLLIFDNDHFVQYLEGPSSKLDDCYRRIVNDERHCQIDLVIRHPISSRAVPDWSMKLLHELPEAKASLGQHDLVDYLRSAA